MVSSSFSKSLIYDMTRINVGIEPWKLPDELLLAELREIKRLPYFKRTLKDQTSPSGLL